MGRMSVVLLRLFFFLFVSSCVITEARLVGGKTASTANNNVVRMPGFLYARSIGRCTPQFWSSGREPWPNMVPMDSSVAKVFGSRLLERYEPELTILEATQRNDDVGGSAYAKLVKQSSAALLNSYTRPGFPYSAWEIKSLVFEALVSDEAAASQAEQFRQANQACN